MSIFRLRGTDAIADPKETVLNRVCVWVEGQRQVKYIQELKNVHLGQKVNGN